MNATRSFQGFLRATVTVLKESVNRAEVESHVLDERPPWAWVGASTSAAGQISAFTGFERQLWGPDGRQDPTTTGHSARRRPKAATQQRASPSAQGILRPWRSPGGYSDILHATCCAVLTDSDVLTPPSPARCQAAGLIPVGNRASVPLFTHQGGIGRSVVLGNTWRWARGRGNL